jgi:hypothetical protein
LAIQNWLSFCGKVGVLPGRATSLSEIDWDNSFLYTFPRISRHHQVCRIAFKNNVLFESIDGVVFSHYCADACFRGDYLERRAWTNFQGKVERRWEQAAAELQERISRQLGAPRALLEGVRPFVRNAAATAHAVGLTRTVIEWRRWVEPDREISIAELPLVFTAELDLQTGDTKWIDFHDPKLLGWKDSGAAK